MLEINMAVTQPHITPILENQKRGRGRPRKYPLIEAREESVKRGRGRPRKYPILAKELLPNGEVKPVLKKVDSGFLVKHLFTYFTKLLVIHSELSMKDGSNHQLFQRLKMLDFQMADICKNVLSSEYHSDSSIEENTESA